jgi:hypothetical protein
VSNVVNLHGDKRWKAVTEYAHENGPIVIEHYFEEIGDLHNIIEQGPDWNTLVKCTVTLNRGDGGEQQESKQQARQHQHR